jgi:hypothetical protein
VQHELDDVRGGVDMHTLQLACLVVAALIGVQGQVPQALQSALGQVGGAWGGKTHEHLDLTGDLQGRVKRSRCVADNKAFQKCCRTAKCKVLEARRELIGVFLGIHG